MRLFQKLLLWLAVATVLGCGPAAGVNPEDEVVDSVQDAVTPAPAYPLKISANGRYLEDQGGTPFLWVGESVWTAAASMTPAQMDLYLDNRRAKGFSVAQVMLIATLFAKNAPNDAAGHPPFTSTLSPGVFDMTTPNAAYFQTVEVFFQKAQARGMAVLVAHNYLGYQGGNQGWFTTLKANGAARVRQWGQWVGARYKNQSNLIWLAGGDYTPADADKWVVDESSQGIRDAGATQLMTAHTARGETSASIWGSRSWFNIDTVYTGPPNAMPPLFRTEYARTPARPIFMIEARYENELDWTPGMIRYQAYQPYLTGGMGQIFGNEPIWHNEGTGIYPPPPFSWQTALDMQGSQDMGRLASVLGARTWSKLVPDSSHTLLTSGFGSGLAEIVASRASDGSFALVYVPSTGTGSNTFTIAMSQLSGPVTAQWYNPTSGAYTTLTSSPFANSANQTLSTPGNNGTSTNDWLLVLTASSSPSVLTSISVTPASASVSPNASQAFAATAFDQFAQPLSPQPSYAWAVSGGGTISSAGVFNAGGSAGGPFSVTASSGGKTGSASVTVATGATTTLSALADAYVRDGSYAATNFGSTTDLVAKNDGPDWTRRSYLKFDTSSVSGAASGVKLRLFGSIAGGEQVSTSIFPVADSSWTESGINWNNKPAAGSSALGAFTVIGATGTWYEWTVTAYVNAERAAGRNLISLVVVIPGQNTNPVTFNSDEAASNRPQLVVTF